MVIRPDRARFWLPWRARLPRLVVIVAGAVMVSLLLVAIDWRPLVSVHLGWLVTIAVVLLGMLWVGIAFSLSALAVVTVALQVEQIELGDGRLRRRMVFGRRMEVPVEGASLTRGRGLDVILAAATRKRLLAPHVFYAPEDLDRLWAVAGITRAGEDPT